MRTPNYHIRHQRVEQTPEGNSLELGKSFLLTRLAPIEDVPHEDLPLVLTRPDMMVETPPDARATWEPSARVTCIAIVSLMALTGLVLIALAYMRHHTPN